MKKNAFFARAALAALCVFSSPAFAQYWTGDGGKGIRLAVLEPEGNGISEEDRWTLSVVQNVICTDFGKYSGMTIIDRQNLEKVFEEWKESMSGHYSDEDRIKIGNLTNASHILNGTVIKTPNAFMLELSVTDLQSGERKASYSQPVSASALENHSAIKEASADLLKQLGVNLTGTALAELKQAANTARLQAEEALARGIVAKRQGTEVAALSYFYQAAALDPTLLEAAGRSSVMSANISSGNIGDNTRNDIAWRRDWVARLTEAEQFFDNLFKTNSLPYTLFYSTKIIPGDINYKTETQSLSINTNLRASEVWVWLSSVEQALQAVYDGLDATKRKRDWGLESWPWRGVTELRPFERKSKAFSIAAELVNSRGAVIGKTNFKSEGEWGFSSSGFNRGRPKIHISNDDRKQVKFAGVKADDITDRITIRIASVNDIDAETAARSGVLQVKAISEAEWDTYVLFKMERSGIAGYNGSGSDLVIPDSIWNEPVTSVEAGVFKRRNITSITIGENVNVHENAFGNKFSDFYNSNRTHGMWFKRRAGEYIYDKTTGWEKILSEEEKAMLEQQKLEKWERERPERERQEREVVETEIARKEAEKEEGKKEEAEKEAKKEKYRTSWQGSPVIVLPGVLIMANSIDSTYSGSGIFFSLGSEFFYGGADFIRIGLDMDLGFIFTDHDEIEKMHPDAMADTSAFIFPAGLFKLGAFASLHPVSFWYLLGSVGIGYYGAYDLLTSGKNKNYSGSGSWAPVYSVGTGLVFGGALFLEVQYHIPQFKDRDAQYFSVRFGLGHWTFY